MHVKKFWNICGTISVIVFIILALSVETDAKTSLVISTEPHEASSLFYANNNESPPPFLEYQIYQNTIFEDPDIVVPVYGGYGSYATLFEKHDICEKALKW